MKRKLISSGSIWEEKFGYSRAVKIGNMVFVAGTTATDENSNVMHAGDAYGQTVAIIKKIEKALEQAGASLKDIVRLTMYVTDISQGMEVGRATGEYFKDIKPANTMVEVSAFVHPDMLVEISADAVITN
ncbi:MAG: RidA family protein [Bacteroidetes bacterium]|nr:RidA family protein [Bacteroidota bacterium]MBX7044683.1 RidA family protein [Ignavibacteria bacterium]